ncbi:MAG: hypothetical protein J1F61_02570 [Clostridiales bacterium]|nr:hypothetical protein [Clostridiales bacterium]
MTKFHTKLLVFLSVLICSLCLILGITACNNSGGEHKHTFGGFWLFDGADGHYRFATCHPEVKSELEPHVDETGDFKCDLCGYVMHVHVDEDGDFKCDECQTVIHKHTYKEEWSFNEISHWHEADCEHFIERSDYDDHNFVEGVCECGVKESEVKVYDLYKNSPEYQLYFTQWLDWLAEHEITSVEITESGDGVYHYKDGHSEVRFLGARTVKVKATSEGEPLANVWIMVSMANDNSYYEHNGTIALGIAKTDESGIAEITFTPVGGYSSSKIQYRIRIAERKDIAVFEGVIEENASLPFPNRYQVAGGNDGFEYVPYEVSENGSSDDIAAAIEFTYSAGWNTYNKHYLPYRRYYTDMLNAEGLVEEGFTYELTTSGDNLFDYFYFSPQQYDFKQGSNSEENRTIEANAKLASSGVYRISFTIEGNATAVLYFWDEMGIQLDGAGYMTNPDGTPASAYVTAISGTGSTDKYTGGNFIDLEITIDNGLRLYQFGIKSDVECKVTFTVERTGDYDPNKPDFNLEKVEEGKYSVSDANLVSYVTTNFGLPKDVPAGVYTLTVTPISKINQYAGMVYAYTEEGKQVSLWEGTGASGYSAKRLIKGIISINEGDKVLGISSACNTEITGTVTLERYDFPTFNANGEYAYLPATPETWETSYTNTLSATPGEYTLEIIVYTNISGDCTLPMKVKIGDNVYTIDKPSVYAGGGIYDLTYKTSVTVGENDTTISLLCGMNYSLTARVKLTATA